MAAIAAGVSDEVVRDAVQQVVVLANPVLVIAFGSWARREHRPGSDLDLAVILDRESRSIPDADLRASVHVPIPMDLLGMTGAELSRLSLRLNSVHRDIVEEGVLVYQRQGARRAFGSPVPTREDLLQVKVDEVKLMLKKARSDENSLGLEGQSPQIAAFHGQQAIEKLLKAWLIALDIAPPKTHELNKLEDELTRAGQYLPTYKVTLKSFNDYAVKWRYADIPDPDRIELIAMRETVADLREYIRAQIGALLPEMA